MAKKKQDKQALVPELRFPEFGGDGEWREEKLKNHLTESRVRGSSGDLAKKLTVKLWGKGVFEKEESTSGSINTQYYRRKSGQFIYSKLDFLNQAFGIVPQSLDGFESTVDLPCFDIGKDLHPIFLLEYVQRKAFYKRFGEIADGGRKAKRIQVETFFGFPIVLPSRKEEQQKIADCLGSLDDLIAAHSAKRDALQDHKKGLLQQLFPAEGESTPKLRFPEFEGAGDWEQKRLEELARYENGKAHEKDISDDGRYIVVNSKFISTEGEVKKFSNMGFCVADTGDLLMVLSDVPNGRAIAKCYFVESDDLYSVNQRISRIQPTKVNGKLLFYILDRNSYFLDFDDGVKQTNLRKEDVLGCPLCVPLQPAEQQRVTDCLTALDSLITAQTTQIAALKEHKKGLMQQLFPNPELSKA